MPKLSPEGQGGAEQLKETLCAKARRQERESCFERKKNSGVWLNYKIENELWEDRRLWKYGTRS